MSYSSSKKDSRPWADIPQELLEAITSRMPSIDQIRCSTVCKTWNRILKEIGLAFGSLPWMMFYGRISSNSAVICELYEPMYRKTYPVHLENLFHGYSSNAKKLGFGAHGYKNGWMVFGFGSQLAIYNLFTHEVVKLPNMDGYWFDDGLQVTFSSSNPKSSDCLFLALHSQPGFLDDEPDFLDEPDFFYEAGYTISMCRSGDKAWKTKPPVTFGLGVCRSIIQLEGKKNLFCLSDYGSLGVFDVATETWYLIKDLKSGGERLFGHSSTSILVERDGELLCIYDAKGGDNHNSWKVARFDFWEIDWVKEEGSCFRDRALFFHFNSWFWIPAGKGGEARELANTVNYYVTNGQYYSYKVGTRKNILPHLHSHSQLFTNISEDEVRLKKAWIIPPRL